VPLLQGQTVADWRQEFVYEYFFERQFADTPTLFGLRTPRMKLSVAHGLEIRDELFDLQADPGEVHNVIDDPAYADRRKALLGRMRKHFDELGLLRAPVWGRNWVADPATAARAAGEGTAAAGDEPAEP
jgi:N-acetylglucosamine-6-sulfatase